MQKLHVIITGATGMVGEGVLQACLANEQVESILLVNRKPSQYQSEKIKEVILSDLSDISQLGAAVKTYNACFFCAGVSSVGMKEEEYYQKTYTLMINFAEALLREQPDMTFCYVSGTGTDSTEQGRLMWARVKGKTENKLLRLPFKAVYNFRPGFMRPYPDAKHIKGFFKFLRAIYPVLRPWKPSYFLTLEEVGNAMINVSLHDYNKDILEPADISFLAANK